MINDFSLNNKVDLELVIIKVISVFNTLLLESDIDFTIFSDNKDST